MYLIFIDIFILFNIVFINTKVTVIFSLYYKKVLMGELN